MKIKIEKIVYPGKSLARIDGKVVFTDQGLPDETVEIAITKETTGYSEAKTTEILSPSPHRVESRCGHYQACSAYQCIDYPKQVEIKKEQILDLLTRQLKLSGLKLHFRESSKIWSYRNKVTLKLIHDNGITSFAYNLPGEIYKFIPLDECFLLPNTTNLFLKDFIKTIPGKLLLPISQVRVKENSKKQLLISLYHNSSLEAPDLSSSLKGLSLRFDIAGITLINQSENIKAIVWGKDFFEEKIEDRTFYIGDESFFQVNVDMLSILVKDLKDNLDLNTNKSLADLYCGVGTFGILLASKLKSVIGVESGPENFFFLEKNIKLNNIENFNVRMCDCEDTIRSLLRQTIDIVIVDPPRKGMDSKICNTLVKAPVPELVYISCNPATLMRDLKILLGAYNINNIYAYDFFPHTPHIETMIFLTKK
ncbi:MAG: 23S rRNA (uracil(1939)-C(5))-methyltransferase RlmD [Candidatus Omnitrophota bacterium]